MVYSPLGNSQSRWRWCPAALYSPDQAQSNVLNELNQNQIPTSHRKHSVWKLLSKALNLSTVFSPCLGTIGFLERRELNQEVCVAAKPSHLQV